MKKVLLLTLICFSFSHGTSSAQTCTECKERVIIIYDNEVKIPEPDYASMPVDQQIDAYREWTNLFYIAGGVRNCVQGDPTASCFTRLDAAFFTEPDSINTTIRTDLGHPNIPPASGSVASGNYIIYGVVTGGGASYNLQLKLETAKSRELVKEFNIPYAAGFDPISTGFNAASGWAPLYTTCMDFEKKKRDEGEPFAIKPTLQVIPAKTKINPGESTDVEITLTDCDQVPLKNRNIEIMAEAGSFDSSTLTTDESGKCTARYTAGNDACTDQVTGRFTYRQPTQAPENRYDETAAAFIEVGNTPNWIVEGDFTFRENVSFEQTIGESSRINSETVRYNRGTFDAVLEMKLQGIGKYTTNNTVTEKQMGESVEAYTKRTLTQANDEHTSVYNNEVTTSYCASLLDRYSGQTVNISIGSNDRHIAYTTHALPALGGGQSNSLGIYCQDGTCVTYSTSDVLECPSNAYEDGIHSYNLDGVGSQDTAYSEFITLAEGWTVNREVSQIFREDGIKFFFQYFVKSIEEHIVADSKQITKTIELTSITVNSYRDPTSSAVFPAPISELGQNTPNPFSTVTVISYALLKPGNIRLSVVDPCGREVSLLENSFREEGDHSVNFDASGLQPGIYFCRLSCNGFISVKKMLLIR